MKVKIIKKKESKIDRYTGRVASKNLRVAAYAKYQNLLQILD